MSEPVSFRLSRERIQHLARVLVEAMDRNDAVRLLKDREVVRQSIIHALIEEMKQDEERHAHVRLRLLSSKPGPVPGTREWEQAFRKLLDEEYEKQGFDTS